MVDYFFFFSVGICYINNHSKKLKNTDLVYSNLRGVEMDKNILTRKEVAEYLGISLSKFATVQKEISCIKFGGVIRFRKEDIDEWLNSKLKEGVKQELQTL